MVSWRDSAPVSPSTPLRHRRWTQSPPSCHMTAHTLPSIVTVFSNTKTWSATSPKVTLTHTHTYIHTSSIVWACLSSSRVGSQSHLQYLHLYRNLQNIKESLLSSSSTTRTEGCSSQSLLLLPISSTYRIWKYAYVCMYACMRASITNCTKEKGQKWSQIF